MKTITLSLSDERYAALTRAQQLMLLAGGTAKSPEEYMQFVADGACDSYAAQYPADAPSAKELEIHKEAAARAEAQAAQEKEKAEAATAQLAALLEQQKLEKSDDQSATAA